MSHGVKFLKPVGDWQNDRPDRDSVSFVFNPNISLAIERQRQRLPVFHYRNHILYLLEQNQIVILVGETGCGKSTQVPQYLHESGWGVDGIIGICEPRRIAATMLASRVAEETGSFIGQQVGYKIRFDDCTNPDTKIKFLTCGVIVREMMADPLLQQYSCIVLDEVHERTIYTDIALGLLRKILKKRPHLRLIVCSATMDAEFFKDYFSHGETKNPASIITVQGRTYPVQLHYLSEPTPDYIKASCDTVLDIHAKEELGDVLVFLTGQEEVETAVKMLKDTLYGTKKAERLHILPLYGSLAAGEQLRAFQRIPQGHRKVVITTNIAETALTIPGIVYVIDSGMVKLRQYDSKSLQESLSVYPISKSAAMQRSGRAGRIRPGHSYRLYSEDEYALFISETPPEITRSDLCSLILELKTLGVDNPLRFHFPTPPPAKHMVTALNLLYAMEGLDDDSKLTSLGSKMADLSLPPLLSKMLLASDKFECSEEMAGIVAMLQVRDVWNKPRAVYQQAKTKHRLFQVEEGDLVSLLNVITGFLKHDCKRSWCDQNYLNFKALTRASKIRNHILTKLRKYDIEQVDCEDDVESVCKCITAGLFVNAAQLDFSGQFYRYLHTGESLYLSPDSVLINAPKPPEWVVFTDVVYSSKEFMQNVTATTEEWLLELGPHFYEKTITR